MNHDRLKEAPVFEKVLPNSQYSKNGGKCAIRNYRITAHGKDGQDGKKKHGNTKIQNSTITFLDIKKHTVLLFQVTKLRDCTSTWKWPWKSFFPYLFVALHTAVSVCTLFPNKRFALNEIFQQYASKFALFHIVV